MKKTFCFSDPGGQDRAFFPDEDGTKGGKRAVTLLLREQLKEKTLVDYEYADGYQAGLETETALELIVRVAQSARTPAAPSSWLTGLAQGWLAKEQASH